MIRDALRIWWPVLLFAALFLLGGVLDPQGGMP